MNRKLIEIGVLIAILAVAFIFWPKNHPTPTSNNPVATPPQVEPDLPQTTSTQVAAPIGDAQDRVTKKPFGIYVTPKNSPVQPERFTGFHTGTDFEIFPPEANADVPFYAICDGKILAKRTASGYGGVFVQSCTIDSQAVTVIYGHVSLKSIAKNIGDSLTKGEQIGNLGQPPSETDGERKQLHLGIHKGTSISILGYVQEKSDLSQWLDYQKLQ